MTRRLPPEEERPDVVVHIGEIVVHGLAVSDNLGDAVRDRLAALILERGLPTEPAASRATVRLSDQQLAPGVAAVIWERLEVR